MHQAFRWKTRRVTDSECGFTGVLTLASERGKPSSITLCFGPPHSYANGATLPLRVKLTMPLCRCRRGFILVMWLGKNGHARCGLDVHSRGFAYWSTLTDSDRLAATYGLDGRLAAGNALFQCASRSLELSTCFAVTTTFRLRMQSHAAWDYWRFTGPGANRNGFACYVSLTKFRKRASISNRIYMRGGPNRGKRR